MIECKINKGSILTEGSGMSLHYVDQLGNGDLISRAFMKRYLKSTYGLTDQEYYNIVVYGDIELTPLCPYCGKSRKFWRLINGYYYTCSDYNCISRKHSDDNVRRWSELTDDQYEDFCHKLGFASKKDPLLRARAEISRLTTLYPSDSIWYLYIADTEYGFKFGISQSPEARMVKMKYKSIKVYASGDIMRMTKFEYDIKAFRNNSSEYFTNDELNSIIQFIKLHD